MKITAMYLAIVSLVFLSCSEQPSNVVNEQVQGEEGKLTEILFQLTTTDTDDLSHFEDGIIPWISIENAKEEIANLIGKDDIVVSNQSAILIIDYPVAEPFEVAIKTENPEGFTRAELALKISEEYKRIYREEEKSTSISTIPVDEREGVANRNQTNGKYGIWGHDLIDLDLSAAIVRYENGKVPKLELFIES